MGRARELVVRGSVDLEAVLRGRKSALVVPPAHEHRLRPATLLDVTSQPSLEKTTSVMKMVPSGYQVRQQFLTMYFEKLRSCSW